MAHEDEDHLYSYFNKSVSAVQSHADEFERSFARPALATSQAFFDERPIAATFIAIFSLLSFLPVASFIGFALFAVVSFSIAAISFAFLASIAIVFSLLSLLILTLLATFTVSSFLTLTSLSAYASYRLVSLLQEHGTEGIPQWTTEMRDALFSSTPSHCEMPRYEAHFEDVREVPTDIKTEEEQGTLPDAQDSSGGLSDKTNVEPEY